MITLVIIIKQMDCQLPITNLCLRPNKGQKTSAITVGTWLSLDVSNYCIVTEKE